MKDQWQVIVTTVAKDKTYAFLSGAEPTVFGTLILTIDFCPCWPGVVHDGAMILEAHTNLRFRKVMRPIF
jgi:hypothetical protein